MKIRGNDVVLRHLFENQEAINSGHEMPHNILMVGSGGGMCGVIVAAEMAAMHDAGITAKATNHFITASASGGAVAGYLCGMPSRVPIMFMHLAVSGFVTGKGPFRRVHIQRLANALRGEVCPIYVEQERIKAHPSTWHVVVSDYENGGWVFEDAKKASPDAVEAVCASMAIGTTRKLGSRVCTDGSYCMPLPAAEGIKRTKPSDILILTNRPHPEQLPWLERNGWPILVHAMLWKAPLSLRKSAAAMDRVLAVELERIKKLKHIHWAHVTPTTESVPINPWTVDILQLQKATDEAKCFMLKRLKKAQPSRHI